LSIFKFLYIKISKISIGTKSFGKFFQLFLGGMPGSVSAVNAAVKIICSMTNPYTISNSPEVPCSDLANASTSLLALREFEAQSLLQLLDRMSIRTTI
jgi:hypothetical protein